MRFYLKEGWNTARRHLFMLLMLFLYQFAWGFFLYRWIQSIAVPLLHRYPNASGMSGQSLQVFLAESQFRLLKTDLSHPYLWILLAIFLGKIALTPLLQAGVNYTLHQPQPERFKFFVGIRQLGKRYSLLYALQTAAALAPVYWLYRFGEQLFNTSTSLGEIGWRFAPWLLLWLAWLLIVRVLVMYLQFGCLNERTLGGAARIFGRYLLMTLGLSLVVLLLSGLLSMVALTCSLLWAGFFAVLAHQALPLVKTGMKLWEVSVQYRYLSSKLEKS